MKPLRNAPGGSIVLIGFMGSGKTTVGRALARRLRWRFLDMDRAIERTAGMSVPVVFRTLGERRFRRIEHAVVRTLASRRRTVVAAGGGAPVVPANRPWLRRAGLLVHLAVPPRELARRLGRGAGRPLLAAAGGDPRRLRALIAGLVRTRAAAYARADVVVAAGRQSPRRLAARLERLTRGWRQAHDL